MGPTISNPGPIFPRQAAAAVAAVIMSTWSKETINVLTSKSEIYKNKKLVMFDTLLDETFLLFNFIGTTAVGCSLLYIPRLINFSKTKTRTVLTAPLADEEEPPININIKIIDLHAVGQILKSEVV